MLNLNSLYIDNRVVVKQIDDRLQCEWIAKNEINKSYMEAKLNEVIGNKFPGAWPVQDEEEANTSRGMRCFTTEWESDILIARWI